MTVQTAIDVRKLSCKKVCDEDPGKLNSTSKEEIGLTKGLQFVPEYYLSSCGHGTKAVIQTHKSINEWRIRMFRPTDMDPRTKGVIRRPRIVSIW